VGEDGTRSGDNEEGTLEVNDKEGTRGAGGRGGGHRRWGRRRSGGGGGAQADVTVSTRQSTVLKRNHETRSEQMGIPLSLCHRIHRLIVPPPVGRAAVYRGSLRWSFVSDLTHLRN
jgi:hypothetical protein